MQFFFANLYSERLSGVTVPATEPSSAMATVVPDDARLPEVALVGSR
ncbi:hypothetical protein CAE01nite_28400 [Cellulomonas aerilata]|uniref:Uncharacterized protein n=2 Tax=Cellulomonas aerilata TaxID=515326 RepID=A0A512DF79_9CELL|nr:hypothetical protein CAE01nite_28400 [Cellulomonas aerilata]